MKYCTDVQLSTFPHYSSAAAVVYTNECEDKIFYRNKVCMGINISVLLQYNGGFLPDIILLTQSYLRGTRLNTMHGLCTYNLYNSILF